VEKNNESINQYDTYAVENRKAISVCFEAYGYIS
jgi:hypothetical protein